MATQLLVHDCNGDYWFLLFLKIIKVLNPLLFIKKAALLRQPFYAL